ncbi:MAG: JAB domain-containing protein [Bacteroidales bacterium]|jgi:DNA repair protein RadC|nr:JAB domain-containing protein [Bacteroidales bacterium]MBR5216658.1 JAB domain-containing protein [Bacteroidales bacterium]
MKNNIVSEVELTYKNNVPYNQRQKISNSQGAYEILTNLFPENTMDYRETFIVLYLNRANQVLGYSVISQGGTSNTTVDIKMVIQTALLANASCIMLAHNHPSGNLHPSSDDNRITNRIIEAARLFDITVLDHIIITNESYYSFTDNGNI